MLRHVGGFAGEESGWWNGASAMMHRSLMPITMRCLTGGHDGHTHGMDKCLCMGEPRYCALHPAPCEAPGTFPFAGVVRSGVCDGRGRILSGRLLTLVRRSVRGCGIRTLKGTVGSHGEDLVA